MIRFKISLVILALLTTILNPSQNVYAQALTGDANPDQNPLTSINSLLNSVDTNRLNQETQPTQVDPGEEQAITPTPTVPEPTQEITPTPVVFEPTQEITPTSVVSEPTQAIQPTLIVSEETIDSVSGAGRTVFLPLISVSQSSFYVSPSGSDSNPGTYAKPWRTIQKAADNLIAGQTVHILPGTYYEKFAPRNSGNAAGYITYTADPGTVVLDGSGVSMSTDSRGDGLVQILGKSYIKVQNLTLRNASVNCANISDNSSGTAASYIEMTGLNIQNCTKVGIRARKSNHLLFKDNVINHITYSSGIGVWFSTDVIVDHNTITNAHYYHECQGAYDEALTISSTSRFEVMNNTLDNTEANPSGFCNTYAEKLGIDVKESSQNGLVHHNTIRNMNAGAIYVDGWRAGSNGTPTLNHINIYNNRISNSGGIIVGCEQADGVVEYINIYNNLLINASFSGIQVRGAHGDGLRKNITIYNNTIYGALPAGGHGGAGIYVTTANLGSNNSDAPVIIRNNISMFGFLSNLTGTVGQIRAGTAAIAAKISASNNLVSGPQTCSTQFPNCVEVGSRITADAAKVFVNPGALDLHLKNDSPAINTGVLIGLVHIDIEGLPRPQMIIHDIGAYEYIPR